ncbi:DUF6455 family protein [Roseicyclus persicicus]|uniref:DUF6455 domain-containing protein n=1 Tax=Roseicyclus persicicus TaxID=2650661 RepID=A0A7X6GYV6_9RHOB|nr:DUF6455 family protein [Roseibacterium persicicum]NKX44209.1 hypothetical protein [Roseibacterium persicicum]
MTGPDPRPQPLGDEKRHYWLAVTMAHRTGADMQQALEAGVISSGDWAGLVQACRGCGWTEGCDCWMARQEDGAADPPAACPNADVFARVLASQGG